MGLRAPPLTKLYHPDPIINRIQDQLLTAWNPLLQATNWICVGAPNAPAFQNGWVNFDGGTAITSTTRSAAFSIDVLGVVRLRGVVKGGSAPISTIFTLPPGYRPLNNLNLVCNSNDAFGVVRILNDGTVAQKLGSNVFQYLDGISFLAEA